MTQAQLIGVDCGEPDGLTADGIGSRSLPVTTGLIRAEIMERGWRVLVPLAGGR